MEDPHTGNSVAVCCPNCEYGQRTVKDDSLDEGWRFEDCDTCRGGGFVWKTRIVISDGTVKE